MYYYNVEVLLNQLGNVDEAIFCYLNTQASWVDGPAKTGTENFFLNLGRKELCMIHRTQSDKIDVY